MFRRQPVDRTIKTDRRSPVNTTSVGVNTLLRLLFRPHQLACQFQQIGFRQFGLILRGK